MQLIVTLEVRFKRTPDGRVWSKLMFTHKFWRRYLEVFDRVLVVARAEEVERAPDGWVEVTGPNVRLHPVPYYLGPVQYLQQVRRVTRAIREAYDPHSAHVLRVPSQIGAVLAKELNRRGHPFGVEVVGDPWDVLGPGTTKHPFRPFYRRISYYQLRRMCREAAVAGYVTEYALQRRYPASPGVLSVGCSDVELPGEAFVSQPRPAEAKQRLRLISVGTLESYYKSPDVVIDALALCVERGCDLELEWVGDGRYRAEIERRARDRGMSDRVTFRGSLPAGPAVRAALDAADVFLLPSRQEGLPRALVEAMARGLPCIGSTVGGIPELLVAEDMVPAGDAEALAARITEAAADPHRRAAMSQRSLTRARDFHADNLREKLNGFLTALRDRTQAFIDRGPAPR